MDDIETVFNRIFIDNHFIEESDDGNVEYKLRLDLKNETSIKKLKTQMIWRLTEGYEISGYDNAFYILGVYDDGSLGNLTETEIDKNIKILHNTINELKFEIKEDIVKNINNSYVYIVHIIKPEFYKEICEKNVVIIGDPQSGKTTLLSNICYDTDIKNNIFKHTHEKLTGITTDIKKEIIGIKNHKVLNYIDCEGWKELYENSDELINIFDIPVINMKNTLNYILSINVHYFIIISKTNIISTEVKLYEDYCKYFNIPYKIFYSTDLEHYQENEFHKIFLELIIKNNTILNKSNSLFRILESYDILDRNNIVSGLQLNKSLNIGDELFIINNKEHSRIRLKSIHKKNIHFKTIKMNESGCVCFDFICKRENNENVRDKKIKINKHTYITNKLNDSIKKIILSGEIKLNGKFLCNIYNGNNIFKIYCNINQFEIELEKPIILTDKKIIIEINNQYYFNKLI